MSASADSSPHSGLQHLYHAPPPALSSFVPCAGSVLNRVAPAHIPKNGKRYHVHTFGCQMNMADSERIAGCLEAAGYECSTDPDQADVLIYNTCSIREKAEQKVYGALGKQVSVRHTHTHADGVRMLGI